MKPILFNTQMVKAILEGRKTVTRRVIKPTPPKNAQLELVGDMRHAVDLSIEIPGPYDHRIYTPPYLHDDVLYVRETWTTLYYVDTDGITHYDQPMIYYAADGTPDITLVDPDGFEEDDQRIRWRPSIHMPKAAARVFLRVTDVRAEQLQESFFCHGATVRNLAAEGIDIGDQCRECIETYGSPCCVDAESECGILDDVRDDFAKLWDSTINPADLSRYGWAADPWVWVIEYERITREAAHGD